MTHRTAAAEAEGRFRALSHYNIARGILRAAVARGLDAMATGGGFDYVCRTVGTNRGRVRCKGDNSVLYGFKHSGAGLFTLDKIEAHAAIFDLSDARLDCVKPFNAVYVWEPVQNDAVMILGARDDSGSPESLEEKAHVTLYLTEDWSSQWVDFDFDTVVDALDFMAGFGGSTVEGFVEGGDK